MWVALGIAGVVYSSQQHIPSATAYVALAALLVEITLYLSPGFASVRAWFEALPNDGSRALLLWASAIPPFLIYTIGTGTCSWQRLAVLAAISGVISLWYVTFPRTPAADVVLVAAVATVLLSDGFKKMFPVVVPKLRLEILGQLMLTRTLVFAVLSIRKLQGVNFGFVPRRQDWRIGVVNFLIFAPIGFGLGFAMHYVQFRQGPYSWMTLPLALGTFVAMLLVLAVEEEFIARGMVQQALTGWFRSPRVGLAVTSALFGLVHLPFRFFPNWKHVLLAAILGYFCGRAYQQSKSIRAGMVTHALAVTVWRIFLL